MRVLEGQCIEVLVRAGSTPDEFLLTGGTLADRKDLLGVLRRAFPNTPWTLAPEGVRVAAMSAVDLGHTDAPVRFRWDPEAERMLLNRRRAQAVLPAVRDAVARLRVEGRPAAERALLGIPGLATLDDHQCVNVACMTIPDGFGLCVFDEQGAGKTVTTIFAYDALVERDLADVLLIIAPKSMVTEWPRDFRRFTGDRYAVRTVAGSRRAKRLSLAADADVYVTNFETAVQLEPELRNLLARYRDRALLVVDESFFAKNLDAQRTVAVRRLREWCGRAFVLCGTPAPNAPHDLVQQFNVVDFGLTFAGLSIPEDRDAARPVIRSAMLERGLYVRHLKVDVLPDLPTKEFNRVLVPLQPLQADLYTDALHGLIRDLEAADDTMFRRRLANFLARRMALLQLCSHPAAVVPAYDEVPAKLVALDALLSDLIEHQREKVVLWSYFTRTIDAITERYRRYSPVRYDGQVDDTAARSLAVRRFQEDETTMLFVANPAAAGAGLTLHRARYAIYESLSGQAAHYLQSLDRIHRRGQTRDVSYLILLCDRTIEMQEYDRILRKERAAQALLGDAVEPAVTRQAMLAEVREALRLVGGAT